MTQEALNKAKVLENDLSTLRSNLEIWESATQFGERIQLLHWAYGYRVSHFINNDFIDFDHLKLVTVARIKKMIADKEKQLEAL